MRLLVVLCSEHVGAVSALHVLVLWKCVGEASRSHSGLAQESLLIYGSNGTPL